MTVEIVRTTENRYGAMFLHVIKEFGSHTVIIVSFRNYSEYTVLKIQQRLNANFSQFRAGKTASCSAEKYGENVFVSMLSGLYYQAENTSPRLCAILTFVVMKYLRCNGSYR